MHVIQAIPRDGRGGNDGRAGERGRREQVSRGVHDGVDTPVRHGIDLGHDRYPEPDVERVEQREVLVCL